MRHLSILALLLLVPAHCVEANTCQDPFDSNPRPVPVELREDFVIANATPDEVIRAIHQLRKDQFLVGFAKLGSPFFSKNNHAQGTTIQHALPGVAHIDMSAVPGPRGGTLVLVSGRYLNEAVEFGHKIFTNVERAIRSQVRASR